jgi:hypothetical protein
MSRHLISLIDGTRVSAYQNDVYSNYSNVYELSHLLQLKDRSEDGKPQIVFYTSGISSQPGTRDLLALMTGKPIVAQILDQYTNLCANYNLSLWLLAGSDGGKSIGGFDIRIWSFDAARY